MCSALQAQARQLKQPTLSVYKSGHDRRTPTYVRVLALLVTAYTLSPIDLIPDSFP